MSSVGDANARSYPGYYCLPCWNATLGGEVPEPEDHTCMGKWRVRGRLYNCACRCGEVT